MKRGMHTTLPTESLHGKGAHAPAETHDHDACPSVEGLATCRLSLASLALTERVSLQAIDSFHRQGGLMSEVPLYGAG